MLKFACCFQGYEIAFAIYNTPWFLMKPRFRRYLSLIMVDAQRPPVLTVGKLMDINFVAFSWVNIKTFIIFLPQNVKIFGQKKFPASSNFSAELCYASPTRMTGPRSAERSRKF